MKVLIISQNFDITTDLVIKWLRKFKIDYFRINLGDIAEINQIEIENAKFYFVMSRNGTQINSNEISSIWYRRGNFSFVNILKQSVSSSSWAKEDRSYIPHIEAFLNREPSTLTSFVYHLFEHYFPSCEANYGHISGIKEIERVIRDEKFPEVFKN
jgi:hypothetical protein